MYWVTNGAALFQRTPAGVITSVPLSSSIQSLGVDPTDGLLYGTGNSAGFRNHLYRIAADGTATDLGAVIGMPTTVTLGLMTFDEQGTLWVSNISTLWSVDVASLAVLTTVTPSSSLIGDLVFVNGQMYAGVFGLARVDTTTGVVTPGPSTGVTGFNAGWWSFKGHLYVPYQGGIGEVVGFDTAAPQTVRVAPGPASVGDGASDPTAPNPFLAAVDDNFTASPMDPATGGTTATVFTNDTNNGVALAATDVTASITNVGGLTGATINPDGTINVPAAAVGDYTVTYNVCRTAVGQTAICDTANARIRLTAAPVAGSSGGVRLAATGADPVPAALLAGGLLAGGLILLLGFAAYRRRELHRL